MEHPAPSRNSVACDLYRPILDFYDRCWSVGTRQRTGRTSILSLAGRSEEPVTSACTVWGTISFRNELLDHAVQLGDVYFARVADRNAMCRGTSLDTLAMGFPSKLRRTPPVQMC